MKRIFLTLLFLVFAKISFACLDSFSRASTPSGDSLLLWSFTNKTFYGSIPTLAPGSFVRINFGDGAYDTTISYAGTVKHLYTTIGLKYVTLKNYLIDSGGSIFCIDSVTRSINVQYPTCGFKLSDTLKGGRKVLFKATCPAGTSTLAYYWIFGDGFTGYSTTDTISHTYLYDGTFNVQVHDTNLSGGCTYNNKISVTVAGGTSAHSISGTIYKDTLYSPTLAIYKVWLIQYDSISHIIHAVDSTLDTGTTYTPYHFDNVNTGAYLIKAVITNGPTSGSGYVPTYHTASTSWSTADIIHYDTTLGSISGQNINMQHGITTSGSGFVAGDVRYGAGKGTAVGDPVKGLLMMLRNSTNQLVAFTYTDASGHYYFSNISYGQYGVYPEDQGYTIVAAGGINLSPFTDSAKNVNFIKTATAILPGMLGVRNVDKNHIFRLYPNPTKGKLILQWNGDLRGAMTVSVINTIGQRAYQVQINPDNTNQTELDLSSLQQGVYFINIESERENYNTKLLIQH